MKAVPNKPVRQGNHTMQRALVVGGSGFVGRALLSQLGSDRGVGTWRSKPTRGLAQFDAVTGRLSELLRALPNDITHVFVPFGMINPEQCARDPAGTRTVNVDSVIRLMEDAFAAGLVPIFVSSDYVYDGSRPLRTEDEPQAPNTEYGRQKAAVERWLGTRHEPWLVTRLSKVVSGDSATHGILGPWVNDIRNGRAMRSATDQIFSPAFVDDVAGAMIRLVEANLQGIYHVAGSEPISRYDLNRLLVDSIQAIDARVEASVEACSLRDIPSLEQRPLNTSLSIAKLTAAIAWPFVSMTDLCRAIATAEFA
jgi:dTDP-4-dehydrorhamnose reductase